MLLSGWHITTTITSIPVFCGIRRVLQRDGRTSDIDILSRDLNADLLKIADPLNSAFEAFLFLPASCCAIAGHELCCWGRDE
jgi:hypothetical protein